MKRIFLLSCFIGFATVSFSQKAESKPALSKQDYLQKSKSKKTTAWVLLGTGAGLDIIGALAYPKHYNDWGSRSERNRNVPSIVLLAAGTSLMIISIPFFAGSHSNKEKAANLAIDTQQFQQLKNNNAYSIYYPALKMTITL